MAEEEEGEGEVSEWFPSSSSSSSPSLSLSPPLPRLFCGEPSFSFYGLLSEQLCGRLI